MPATLRELAERFDCRLDGDGDIEVSRVGTLANAAGDAVSFLANPAYRGQLGATRAAAVILDERDRAACPAAVLLTSKPYPTYARIAAFLHPPPQVAPGVDASASVAADAVVSESAQIGPGAVIGAASRIGERAVVGAGSVLGARVTVGEDTRLAPRVAVLDGVSIGRRCIVHSGAVIGADGFGFAPDDGEWIKIPQLGSVRIGDDVEIGANTTIDRGAIDDTVIEDGVKLDNLVQIAHNVVIGAHTVMAAMSGVAGSTKIGPRCMIGGGSVTTNSLEICADTVITFRSVITKSISEPGVYSGCLPAEAAADWRRNAIRFKHLDSLAGRVRALEQWIETNNPNNPNKKDSHND